MVGKTCPYLPGSWVNCGPYWPGSQVNSGLIGPAAGWVAFAVILHEKIASREVDIFLGKKKSKPFIRKTWYQYQIYATTWQNQQCRLCYQRRLKSAWASAQSDQSICCPHEEALGPCQSLKHTAKTDQTGQNPRLIFRWAHMPFCWFCHAAAQILRMANLNLVSRKSVFNVSE